MAMTISYPQLSTQTIVGSVNTAGDKFTICFASAAQLKERALTIGEIMAETMVHQMCHIKMKFDHKFVSEIMADFFANSLPFKFLYFSPIN